MNHRRVERIWRREGLKVPFKRPKRGRLRLNDGSCVQPRPCWQNHVWAYDFVQARTHDGRAFRMLTVIDEFTRECLAIEVSRRLRSDDVLQVLAEQWRHRYNAVRPHSALGCRPPAPEAIQHHRVDLSRALDGLRTDRRFRQASRSLD